MLETLRAASWKARIFNAIIVVCLLAAISGCFVSFLGVLQEGRQDTSGDPSSLTWEFSYNGVRIRSIDFWSKYDNFADDTHLNKQCYRGGRILLLLQVLMLFALIPSMVLATIRIFGIHLSQLQPVHKFLNIEFYLALISMIGQFLSCLIWGVTCYQATTELSLINDVHPTGFIWLILCNVFLVGLIGIYWILRSDPSLILGSAYGGELNGTEQNEAIVHAAHDHDHHHDHHHDHDRDDHENPLASDNTFIEPSEI